MEYEKDLGSSSEKQQLLVSELEAINILNVDKYLRTCWRKIITDEVAELFSWKGTGTKSSAIGLATTAAIRSACRQKFNSDEEVFISVSKKHFQNAHDRQKKIPAYRQKR
ncbi:PREDICTED: uncharacterized protein LOC108359969 isoform X2 [Rhagoletis zephyria]|nr:PREDICTED: uncharacterized protein LOC108359969 isoform X2 [Rhagoletis zephyria]